MQLQLMEQSESVRLLVLTPPGKGGLKPGIPHSIEGSELTLMYPKWMSRSLHPVHHPTRNSPEAPGAALLAELGVRSGQEWGLVVTDLSRTTLQLNEVVRPNYKSCHLDLEF